MDIQKHYQKIVVLKKNLVASPTINSFLDAHKEDLLTVLDDSSLSLTKPTKKSLLDTLQEKQSMLALQLQSVGLRKWLHEQKIVLPKSVLERKKKEEMAKQNYLPMILQLACSHPEYYFRKPYGGETTHKELIDYVVIDPNKIPEGFMNAFQIEHIDIAAKDIKELFKRATPLEYYTDKFTKTRRIVFIDGKLVVFRELQQLLHKGPHLTQWEKRRVDHKKYFNVYDDIYSAIRSQMYIVDKEHDKMDDYRDLQRQMIDMIQDIAFDTKHQDERRKLDQIIYDIRNATSFPIMASKFYNLYQINFANKTITSKHLEWASNKVSKELHKLWSIILEIQLQTDALNHLLYTQEYTFKLFTHAISKAVSAHDSKWLLGAFHAYYKQLWQNKQKTEPFITLEHQVKTIFWTNFDERYMQTHSAFLKTEALLTVQNIYFKAYTLEHTIKLWTVQKKDFDFDIPLSVRTAPWYKEFFSDLDEYILKIQEFWNTNMSEEHMGICLGLLKKLRTLPLFGWSM